MGIMIPLWYSICLGAAGAFFGFWYGRSRTWGLMESPGREQAGEIRSGGQPAGGERTVCKSARSLISPSGGRVESYQEGEANGVRILTTESRLYSPISGRVVKISPRGNAFLIRTDWGVEAMVRACTNEDDLLDRYFRPRVVMGEVIRKGKLLLEYDREKLCRECGDTAVYLTAVGLWEENVEVEITDLEQVRSGEEILWVY